MNASNGSSGLEIAQSNQDLIITKGKRKKRAWIIGGVIAVIAFAILIAVIVLFTSESQSLGISQNYSAITLEDVLLGRLAPASFNATWVSGNELIYRNTEGNILKYNVKRQSSDILLSIGNQILSSAFDYELSPDQKYLLIAHDYQKLYRHSYVAQYTVVNLETKKTSRVLANNEAVLQYAKWGPVGNSIVYVARYNIFYRPSAEAELSLSLTTDGLQGHIYNGIPDWVYEEEVLSSNKAVWISPDGSYLAYAKFNDTRVPVMTIPVYGQPGSLDFQYPKSIQIRYPKPGTKNPDVTLHVVNLNNISDEQILPAPVALQSEPILSTVAWATKNVVSAIWMNRIQNEAQIISYDLSENPLKIESIRKLHEANGWLELFKPPIFSKNGDELILILSHLQNDSLGSFRHIVMFSRKSDATPTPLTKGTFVVTDILTWDEDEKLIYYQATAEDDPAVQHLYSVSTQSALTKCLSCGIKTTNRKSACLHNSALMSKDNSHYVLQCAGPDVPEIAVYNITGHKISIWEGNEPLVELVQDKAIPIKKRMSFEVADGFRAQVILKLPPNMDLSGNTKYPMLVNVYGGPDSFQVLEKFDLDWGSYLSANKSIIYAMIDARGSGLKGDKMLFSLYKKLGSIEVIDQINVTRQIQQTLPYVDASRTAIWGWSYGGYASGLALALDKENVFKCGISVAPVTDWLLYDSIYTERFMGLPIQDRMVYTKSQLLNKFEGLRNKQYFLVHGSLDDNVHYQQSMLWSKVLEEHDILFRQQSYPDEDHGLASVRPHLYHSLENFLDDCFVVENRI